MSCGAWTLEPPYFWTRRECAPLSPHLRRGRYAEPNDGIFAKAQSRFIWPYINLARASPNIPLCTGWVGWFFFVVLIYYSFSNQFHDSLWKGIDSPIQITIGEHPPPTWAHFNWCLHTDSKQSKSFCASSKLREWWNVGKHSLQTCTLALPLFPSVQHNKLESTD